MELTPIEKEIEDKVGARIPCIYIVSAEEQPVIASFKNIVDKNVLDKKIRLWSCFRGFYDLNDKGQSNKSQQRDPAEDIASIAISSMNGFYVLLDFHHYLRPVNELQVRTIRSLKEVIQKLPDSYKTIFIVAPELVLPSDLERDIEVINYPLPDKKQKIDIVKKVARDANQKLNITPELEDEIDKALSGATTKQIGDAVGYSLVKEKKVVPEILKSYNRNIFEKSGYFIPCETRQIEELAGVEVLKEFLEIYKLAFSDEAIQRGAVPKGLFLSGVQGTGKTWAAICAGSYLRLPTFFLDMNSFKSKYVGESESNFQKIIQIVDSISCCVILDEIDKFFNVDVTSGRSESATPAIFGSFLTWRQRTRSSSILIATANNPQILDPALIRPERWDKMFWFDLPTGVELSSIWNVLLKRYKFNPEELDITKLVSKSQRFTGSDIETVIRLSLYMMLNAKKNGNNYAFEKILSDTLKKTTPLADLSSEQIEERRKWAKEHNVEFASKPEEKGNSESMKRRFEI